MDEGKNEFQTKDLYESAFLYASGCLLIRLEKGERNQFWFVFDDKRKCEQLSNQYWSGEGITKAILFVDAIRRLKDRIFSQR